MSDLRSKLAVAPARLDELNALLTDPHNPVVSELLALVERHGGVAAINAAARKTRRFIVISLAEPLFVARRLNPTIVAPPAPLAKPLIYE